MIVRNDPALIYQGVLGRRFNAYKAGDIDKWINLDSYTWELFMRLAK